MSTAGTVVTQRSLFYRLVHLFDSQMEVNNLVLELAASLECPRHALLVSASPRGVVAGDIFLRSKDGDFDVDGNMAGPVECIFESFVYRRKSFVALTAIY